MSSPLWNKKMRCPFCDGEFETTRLRASAVRIKEKYTDFGCAYEGFAPYIYAITACPHCTVAARNEEFEKFKPAYEPRLMEISRHLREAPNKPDIFNVSEPTAEVAPRRHELDIAMPDSGELAGLWMHVAWIWRQNGDPARERTALAQAAEAYKEFYEKGSRLPEKLGEPAMLYLIGELHRRMEKLRQARTYFSRALMSKDLGAFPNVEYLLRKGMLLAKEPAEG